MGNSFDINFKPLPPKLQAQLWVLGLDADTSRVNLAYRPGNWRTGVAYNYGGNAEAFFSTRRFSTTLGVNPGSGALPLAMDRLFFPCLPSLRVRSTRVPLGFGAWSGTSAQHPTTRSPGTDFTAMILV